MTEIRPAACHRPFRMPSTSSEQLVADAFAAVLLHRDPTYRTRTTCLTATRANPTACIGLDENFFDLGGNSMLAEQLAIRLGGTLDIELPARLVSEAPTVIALACRIDELLTARGMGWSEPRPEHRDIVDRSAFDTLLPLRPGHSSAPLFCIHPITGLAWSFAGLAAHLEPDLPVYGLQSPALTPGADLPGSIESWANLYSTLIRSVQPSGPYRLLGWSFGGLLAHEIAVRLQRAGEQVAFLGIMDSYLSDPDAPAAPVSLAEVLGGLLEDDPGDLGTLDDFDPAAVLARLPEPLASLGTDRFERLRDAVGHSIRLRDAYRAPVYRGEVVYFSATQRSPGTGARAWRALVDGTLHHHAVPTTHWQMTSAPGLARIAEVLRDH
ncbi:thioesterase domain-containing protein [Nocardia sp. NBC_00416]|uniref:thioesterase domain-containing protein n=1 Tax=Nocardia sp. NBC_00416 TaxID=2975991 RepID=UPI002E1D6868